MIRNAIFEAWNTGIGGKNIDIPAAAQALSSRIAREFPEEAARESLRSRLFVTKSGVGHHVSGKKKVIADLKRLWEGEDGKPKDSLELHPENCVCYHHSKPVCSTCGGSRKVPIPRKNMDQENKYWEPCPDCEWRKNNPVTDRIQDMESGESIATVRWYSTWRIDRRKGA